MPLSFEEEPMGRLAPWLAAMLLTLGAGNPAFAETGAPSTQNSITDLSTAHGAGTPGTTDKVVLENVRVIVSTPTSFGGGRFGWNREESIYNLTYRFDAATLRLVPDSYVRVSGTGGTGGCATLEVTVLNSLTGAAAAGATVAAQSRTATTDANGVATLTGLPPGQTLLTVSASGFGTIVQAAELVCTETNVMSAALSPGAGSAGGLSPGQFRIVLTWGRNPADLDSHLTGPLPDSSSRFHVYYASRQNGGICGLDVDDVTSFGPETITCPRTGTTTALPAGVYRYSIHHFSGSGNIGTSGAIVRLEMGDGSTTYAFPPTSGWSGDDDVWTVVELTVAEDGSITKTTVNTITSGGTVRSVPRANAVAQQGFAVDFGSSRLMGAGANKLLVENIRVTEGGQELGYNVLLRLDPVTLDLIPETISQSSGVGASNCAAVGVVVYDAAGGTSARVRGANVTIGNRSYVTSSTGVASFSGVTEGAGTVSVTASGYGAATQAATFSCAGTNTVEIGLTPP
jgi:hypothetical protein